MCVILVCDRVRPTEEFVQKAWDRNSHGAGVAWRDGSKVRWSKGLSLNEVQDRVKSLPLPFVAHFRIASSGSITPALCHPFNLNVYDKAQQGLIGETEEGVLFHNGTWKDWKGWLLDAAFKGMLKIPGGEWNDTRAMTYLAHHFSPGILELIEEKAVVLSPENVEIFGEGWEEREGIAVSNTKFLDTFPEHHYYLTGPTRHQSAASGVVVGGGGNTTVKTVSSALTGQVLYRTAAKRTGGSSTLGITFRGSLVTGSVQVTQQKPVETDTQKLLPAAKETTSEMRRVSWAANDITYVGLT